MQTMNEENVKEIIIIALYQFYKNDSYLIDTKQHEQTLCAKLAYYMQALFQDWHVDVEYNRQGHDIKRLNGKRVRPDIIVHRRGSEGPNLVALLCKAHWNDQDRQNDIEQLKLYRNELGYQNAFRIEFESNNFQIESC